MSSEDKTPVAPDATATTNVPASVADKPGMRDTVRHTKTGDVHTVETICMKCFNNGTSRVLLTKIPMFKELLVTSFECPHCGFLSREVKSVAGLDEFATRHELSFDCVLTDEEDQRKDMSRNIVRSETARILIPEVDFEIQPKRAELNSLEGFLLNIKESLMAGQEERKAANEEEWQRMQDFIDRMEMFQMGRDNFTFIVEDLAGNSFIQNPYAPGPDPRCKVTRRHRTREEVIALGFSLEDEEAARATQADADGLPVMKGEEAAAFKRDLIAAAMEQIKVDSASRRREQDKRSAILREEATKAAATVAAISAAGTGSAAQAAAPTDADGNVLAPERGDGYKAGGSKAPLKMMAERVMNKKPLERFDELVNDTANKAAEYKGECHECGHVNFTKMCLIDIPYFQTVIVMCTTCVHCGYKDSEIKPGGGISDQALKITLSAKDKSDLTRDVLKSDEASIIIPELDLELGDGTLGGKFSTVEGILLDMIEQLERTAEFYLGDSGETGQKQKMSDFIERLRGLLTGDTPFTFIIDDPIGNSFIEGRVEGVPDTDPYSDSSLVVEHYDRTDKQNDMLGLTHMKTEDYYVKKEDAASEGTDSDDEDESSEEEPEAEAEAEAEGEKAATD